MSGKRKVAASARAWLSLTQLLLAELHKISLLTSSWHHCHFPKTLYFYRAVCLLANSRGLEQEQEPRVTPGKWPANLYSPSPSTSPFSASQSSPREETGLFRRLPPRAALEPLSPGGFSLGLSDLSESSCDQGTRDS